MLIVVLIVIVLLLVMGGDWDIWIYCGFVFLLIVCFCVFVFLMFVVIVLGFVVGICRGLLIKGGNVFEIIGKVNVIVFDKIGMFIEGKLCVIEMVVFGKNEEKDVIVLVVVVEMGFSYLFVKVIIN